MRMIRWSTDLACASADRVSIAPRSLRDLHIGTARVARRIAAAAPNQGFLLDQSRARLISAGRRLVVIVVWLSPCSANPYATASDMTFSVKMGVLAGPEPLSLL